MESIMIVLAPIAVIINVAIAYYSLLRPTYFSLKELRYESRDNPFPFFDQERLAFIFLPIVGYITFFVMIEFGFADDLGKHYVPAFILIQIISFALYFYSRKEKLNASIPVIAVLPSLFILGIITCIILAIKLFFCYILCITFGWMFIILPFCVLSYYALFQVTAFQSLELYKLFNLMDNEAATINHQNILGKKLSRNELFVAQIIVTVFVISAVIFIFSWDFLGPFKISLHEIISQSVKF